MRAVIVVLGLALTSPAMGTLNAQELKAKEFELLESTWMEFGGSLDFIMGLMGANDGQTQRLMVSGGLSTVRTDDMKDGRPDKSNIVEFSSGMISVIDHDDESYFTYNIADVFAGGPFALGGQTQPAQYEEPEQQDAGAEYDVRITFASPGGSKPLLDYLAEQLWMTITATPTRAPEGMSLDSMATFIMLTESWVAEDFPGNTAMAEISEEAAAHLSKSVGLDRDAMGQAFSQNPQFANAFEQNQEELEKLRNMPLEQRSVFVSLPPGAEFNPDSALYGSMGELKIDIAGAVVSGAKNAITGGIGRRLGRFGRRREPEPEPEPPPAPPTQTLMFRVHKLVNNFVFGSLASGWNTVPNTYELKESPFQPRQQNR